jgi:hypothetical protein
MFFKVLSVYLLSIFFQTNVEYDIVEIYKGITPVDGTIILTSFNNVEDAELILIPVKIDPGNYAVKVTRKAKDLYSVDGFNIYIKTRFCSEHSVNSEVVLKISSALGDPRGKVIFSE